MSDENDTREKVEDGYIEDLELGAWYGRHIRDGGARDVRRALAAPPGSKRLPVTTFGRRLRHGYRNG